MTYILIQAWENDQINMDFKKVHFRRLKQTQLSVIYNELKKCKVEPVEFRPKKMFKKELFD